MKYLTNSELKVWRRCRRWWYFQHYLNLAPNREHLSEARETGSVVHAAIAEAYETNWAQDPESTVVLACERLREAYAESETDLETIDRIEDYARLIVTGYLQWLEEEGADQGLTLVATEEEVSFEMHGTGVTILGKLDARFQREMDGARVFMDHKVVGNLTDYPKWAHLDPQFKMYHTLERLTKAEEEWTDGGIINMLRKSKRTSRATGPFYMRWEVRHNVHELRAFYQQLHEAAKEMLWVEGRLREGIWQSHMAAKMAPTPSVNCTWECPFFSACPMMDDGSDIAGYLEAAYTVVDPLERYQMERGEVI